jgi:hypothetical protein
MEAWLASLVRQAGCGGGAGAGAAPRARRSSRRGGLRPTTIALQAQPFATDGRQPAVAATVAAARAGSAATAAASPAPAAPVSASLLGRAACRPAVGAVPWGGGALKSVDELLAEFAALMAGVLGV